MPNSRGLSRSYPTFDSPSCRYLQAWAVVEYAPCELAPVCCKGARSDGAIKQQLAVCSRLLRGCHDALSLHILREDTLAQDAGFGCRLVRACAVEWGDEERRAYELLEGEGLETLEALEGERPPDTMTVLQRLHLLRRCCNHPALAGVEGVPGDWVEGPAGGPEGDRQAEHRDEGPAGGSAGTLVHRVQTWLGLASASNEGVAGSECEPRMLQTQGTCAQCGGEQRACATLACGHRICSACCVAQARACPSQRNKMLHVLNTPQWQSLKYIRRRCCLWAARGGLAVAQSPTRSKPAHSPDKEGHHMCWPRRLYLLARACVL